MAVVVTYKGKPELVRVIMANELKVNHVTVTKSVNLTDIIHGGDFSSRYNKWVKKVRVNTGELVCSFCKYHKYENASRPNNSKPRRKEHRTTPLKHIDCSTYYELT